MDMIGSPLFDASAISVFHGLGGTAYVGSGSAVIGRSPSYFPSSVDKSTCMLAVSMRMRLRRPLQL
jgi:hypothetical protein